MSNKDRKRAEQTGLVFRDGALRPQDGAPRPREVSEGERQRMIRIGETALQAMSTGDKVKVLRDSVGLGKLSPDRLRKALAENAPKEMRKGADKLRKKGKPVTVEALLEEYHKDTDFQKLVAGVGLDEAWFTALAEKECL